MVVAISSYILVFCKCRLRDLYKLSVNIFQNRFYTKKCVIKSGMEKLHIGIKFAKL